MLFLYIVYINFVYSYININITAIYIYINITFCIFTLNVYFYVYANFTQKYRFIISVLLLLFSC